MADMLPLKRPRDRALDEEAAAESKREKPYEDILSLLEEEEEVPSQDLSSLITTLQRELSSEPDLDPLACPAPEADPDPLSSSSSSSSSSCSTEVEDERERVIKHLLEASDDELGLPIREGNREASSGDGVLCGDGAERGGLDFCEGLLWELEDEAANYYALLQSELFY